ncbi:hypothetical protein [Flaviaesturariibacter aridisoli]|uniref:Uncharacterized protein n=1 Tax=Flaviaesturariibacter aridisoli TaxID=2545761 RepID=A0A4R4DRS0_9BACT|nr:hypothetical protein [Flaviaesturariibacter aridisoli]TCZ65207.1 hypothetical protein E0486_17570 [Flaviaesturariibacter aridisoli]
MKISTLNSKEIKDRISAKLALKLSVDGFVYNKSSNEFKCTIENYTYLFCIDQLTWSDHFSINVRVYISERQIEDLLERIIGKQRNRLTLGGDIAILKFSPDGRQVIPKTLTILLLFEEDIEAAVETLYQYYLEIAKPFFERYNSLEKIDSLINSKPYNSIPAHFCGNCDTRCMKGLVVAKLTNNPEYNSLLAIYDEEIRETFKDFRKEAIETFNKVIEYFQSTWRL